MFDNANGVCEVPVYGDVERRNLLTAVPAGTCSGNAGNGGALIINDGVHLFSNTAASGSGVYVNGGSFIMNGGGISKNEVPTPVFGGDVYVNNGTFIMNGGSISENKVSSSNFVSGGYSGGIFIDKGTCTINNGEIRSNSAEYGDGIYMQNTVCTINGGDLISNYSGGDGGGVYVDGGTFTKTAQDGVVWMNTTSRAPRNGRAVFVNAETYRDSMIIENEAFSSDYGHWD